MKRIFVTSLLLFFTCSVIGQDYNFSGTMSREKLELYLGRAISMSGLVDENSCYFPPCVSNSSTLYNPVAYYTNVNMLSNIDARFIGRSCGLWGGEWVINSGYFNNVGRMVNDITNAYSIAGKVKPIIQAGIFEIVTSDVNGIQMSNEVASEFGVTKRKFKYSDMLYSDGSYVNQWGDNSSIPDMSKRETQMWFYYLATQYIDNGIEAIHMGQVELMDDKDPTHLYWWSLLIKIRNYAKSKNRGIALLDAHTFGLYFENSDQLLFDFHSSPIRIKEKLPKWGSFANNGGGAIIKDNPSCGTPYNRSKGGKTYFGWYATSLPYLVEFDNYGISENPNTYGNCWFPWGWDEITWFAIQSLTYRNNWLKYAYYKVKCLDRNAFLQMPGRRDLTESGVPWPNIYRAANGYYSQETTIKNIWNGVYAHQNNWIHHNFTNEEVYNQPNPPHALNSLIFVGDDKAFYIGSDGYIHGYIRNNGVNGIWRTVSPSYSAQTFNGRPVSTQVKAARDLVASPDGKTLLYIGIDGYIYGFSINTVWNYDYFEFPKAGMIGQHLKAVSHLQFTSNNRLFYIAKEISYGNKHRVHGFIKTGSNWVTTSPTHACYVLPSNQTEVGGALTFNPYDNRLYYVGVDGFLYYHDIISDWVFSYNAVPKSDLISQNLRIMPFKIAIKDNKIFYIGRELASGDAFRIHALVYSGSIWSTVSPSHSASFYNSQSLNTQQQSGLYEIAISADGKHIAYIGTDKAVYYYKDIAGGWNFSYNKVRGLDGMGAANSLQFLGNQNIYYISQTSYLFPYVLGDKKIHNIRYEESYCENPSVKAIDLIAEPLNTALLVANKREQPISENLTEKAHEILEHHNINSITIYPNPVRDKINILFPRSTYNNNMSFIIFNSVGNVVRKGGLKPDQSINTANLIAGSYLMCILKGPDVIQRTRISIIK